MTTITKKVELFSKRTFFNLIKWMLERKNKAPKKINTKDIKKVLFLRYDKIGDMLISLPVFKALKESFPHISISVMCSPRNRIVLKDDKDIDEIFVYRKRFFGDIKTAMEMRKRRFDCIIDLVFWESVTSAILTAVVKGGGISVGVGKGTYKGFYDYVIPTEDKDKEHIIPKTMQVLEIFGIDPKNCDHYPHLKISEDDKLRAKTFIQKLKGGPLIGLNISAGQASRLWSLDKFAKVGELLKDKNKKSDLVIIYSAKDKNRAVGLQSKLNAMLIPFKSSFQQVAAIIQKLNILITPDTSLIHIAWSSGVPVVGLYCANRKNLYSWKPLGSRSRTVVSKSYYDIFDIEPEEVFKSAILVLKEDVK